MEHMMDIGLMGWVGACQERVEWYWSDVVRQWYLGEVPVALEHGFA